MAGPAPAGRAQGPPVRHEHRREDVPVPPEPTTAGAAVPGYVARGATRTPASHAATTASTAPSARTLARWTASAPRRACRRGARPPPGRRPRSARPPGSDPRLFLASRTSRSCWRRPPGTARRSWSPRGSRRWRQDVDRLRVEAGPWSPRPPPGRCPLRGARRRHRGRRRRNPRHTEPVASARCCEHAPTPGPRAPRSAAGPFPGSDASASGRHRVGVGHAPAARPLGQLASPTHRRRGRGGQPWP